MHVWLIPCRAAAIFCEGSADRLTRLFLALRDGFGAAKLQAAVHSEHALPLVTLYCDPTTSTVPTDDDFRDNACVLECIMLEFPERCPNKSETKAALLRLDQYYGYKLSRVNPRGATLRAAWAELDAASLRFLLMHVFKSVRKGGGSTSARLPELRVLKELVRRPTMRCASCCYAAARAVFAAWCFC